MDIIDDLKSNFRSWETDHDNEEDANGLFGILIGRHPRLNSDKVKSIAYHWVGYEPEEPERMTPDRKLLNKFFTFCMHKFCTTEIGGKLEERHIDEFLETEPNRYLNEEYCGGFFGQNFDLNDADIVSEGSNWIVAKCQNGAIRTAVFEYAGTKDAFESIYIRTR